MHGENTEDDYGEISDQEIAASGPGFAWDYLPVFCHDETGRMR